MQSRIRQPLRQSRQNPIRQGVTIAILILIILWLSSLIFGLIGKAQFAWQMAHETGQDAHALSTRQRMLEQSIATLNTPRGQEAAIRTAFGVARPGERVIIVVPPKVPVEISQKHSWWQRVFGWFNL